MLVTVEPDTEVLGQQDILGIRHIAVFFTQLPYIPPFSGAVFLPSALILLVGIEDADPYSI